MNCREIQERLLKGEPGSDAKETNPDWLAHINKCDECRKLIQDLNFVRINLGHLTPGPVPDPLDQRVARQCHDEINSMTPDTVTGHAKPGWLMIPPLVWVGIALLIVLTFASITPIVGDLLSSEPLSERGLFTLIVIGQNALMLLLSPVIIQKFTQKGTSRSQLFNKFNLQNGSGDVLS